MVVMLGALVLPASPLLSQGDSFDTQLQYLRTQNVAQVGREALVDAYDELIRRHAGNPQTAEAMLEIAALFTSVERPELDVHPDSEKALAWLRQAAATAVEGSPTWIEAQFSLAGYAQRPDPEQAKRIMADVSAKALDKSLLLRARIEQELQNIAAAEGDLDAAESHCRRLLGWYADPQQIPKLEMEKAEIDYLIMAAGASIMEQLRQAPWPVQTRADRIAKLMDDYAGLAALWRDGTEALKSIREEVNSEVASEAREYLDNLLQRDARVLLTPDNPDRQKPAAVAVPAETPPEIRSEPAAARTSPALRVAKSLALAVAVLAGALLVWRLTRVGKEDTRV
jgi:hypothetical protein